jgi:outer membrane protein TolC
MRLNKSISVFIGGLVFMIGLQVPLSGQQRSILDTYIRHGLQNNLALTRKELDLEKSLMALKEANGLFYPSVGIEAQYFLSEGGRSIDFPVGDLLNPVYSSLNEILQGMGEPGSFPQLENQKIQFLPNDYHDTRLRVIMPLVNTEIYYNRRIRKEMISGTQAEINVYKRELIKEIKIAYYRFLQAVKVVEAYQSALELVNEARRVNVKLVENQMAGQEKLYRIEAEQSQVKAQLARAENDKNTAAAYFNLLLNQPLRNSIDTDSLLLNPMNPIQYTLPATNRAYREEIQQLNSAIESTDLYYKMKKSSVFPVISNITDLGYQGYSYTFKKDQQYVMNTVNLSWSLFGGFQNRNRIAQARIESESLRRMLDESELQIELQCSIAEGNLLSSVKSEEANRSSLLSSREYYKVISRQYATGQKSLLDLLDARNQLTTAQIGYNVSHFESLIRLAELERANAQIDLELFNN